MKNNDYPLITIVITAFNYAHLIENAIYSAVNQNYPNIEVLILDNASTDGTADLMEKYKENHRIRYIRYDENVGMNPNHNRAFHEAKGEYISFVSADDLLMPGFIKSSYRFLVEHPEIDVCYGTAHFINYHGVFIATRSMRGQIPAAYIDGRNEFASLLIEGCYICIPTMLIKRSLIDRYGIFDVDLTAADYELVLRWAQAGVKFAYVPHPTAAIRIHPNQRTGHQEYAVTGKEIDDTVYLMRKFVTPENAEKLRGFEHQLKRSLSLRFRYSREHDQRDAKQGGAVEQEILALVDRLQQCNAAKPRVPKISIIMTADSHIWDLDRSLRALIRQTQSDWEVVVVQNPGYSYESLCQYFDPLGRIKHVMLNEVCTPGRMFNTGLRLATGNCFTFMRAGNNFPPDHIEKLCRFFLEPRVQAAFSRTRLVVRDLENGSSCHSIEIYPLQDKTQRYLVSPVAPLEAIACTREALDAEGAFNEGSLAYIDWDLLIRLRKKQRVGFVDSEIDLVHAQGRDDPQALFTSFPMLIRAMHYLYPVEDEDLLADRLRYLEQFEITLNDRSSIADEASRYVSLYRALSGRLLQEADEQNVAAFAGMPL